MNRRALVAGLLVTVVGCGGSDGAGAGGHPLGGTVGGRTFTVADAVVATTVNWKSSFYPGDSTVILLSDSSGLCEQIQSNITKPGTQLVIVNLGEAGAGSARPVTAPGTFQVSDDLTQPRVAMIYYSYVDAQCAFSDLGVSSGSVTLSSISQDGAAATGSLTAALEGGGSVVGDFNVANVCPSAAVDTYLNRNPKCQ